MHRVGWSLSGSPVMSGVVMVTDPPLSVVRIHDLCLISVPRLLGCHLIFSIR
jgi:hypothetical protein